MLRGVKTQASRVPGHAINSSCSASCLRCCVRPCAGKPTCTPCHFLPDAACDRGCSLGCSVRSPTSPTAGAQHEPEPAVGKPEEDAGLSGAPARLRSVGAGVGTVCRQHGQGRGWVLGPPVILIARGVSAELPHSALPSRLPQNTADSLASLGHWHQGRGNKGSLKTLLIPRHGSRQG